MLCALLFPNGWIRAPSIHAEMSERIALFRILFPLFCQGEGENPIFYLITEKLYCIDKETDSFFASFRSSDTKINMTLGPLFVFIMYVKEIREIPNEGGKVKQDIRQWPLG